jgi:2-C-methyl-D-erythritol 4-phosphate cytidylyltransferase
VVVVVPPDAVADAVSLVGDHPDVAVAEGGSTRQGSVGRGLTAALEEAPGRDRVVVHDAARPLVRPHDVARVLAGLDGADGAIAAVPVHDTLKRVEDGRIVATVERDGLWRAQTPQAFMLDVLAGAHARAAAEGFEATDDAQLLERYGGVVKVVPGRADNIKITWPEDFAVAEAMLRANA